jgi:type IV secretion system protein VirD4
MDNFGISRMRFGIALAAWALIAALTLSPLSAWPFMWPSTLGAFVPAGFSLSLVVIAGGLHGFARKACYVLAAVMALWWSWSALSPFYDLAKASWQLFQNWKAHGAAPIASLGAGWAYFQSHLHTYARAYQTCLWVGVPPFIGIGIGRAVIWDSTPRNRIAKAGPWSAQWMGGDQVRHLKSLPFGLPLGLKGGALLRYEPNPAKGWRAGHHLAIAGTRAGKGVSVVIPAIIDHDGPVVCLDVKGENFAVTRRWRAQLGRRVVVLNPFGVIEPSRDGFNPLDYVRREHVVRDIDVIAEGLVRPEPGGGAHFSEVARQMIAAAIEVVVTEHVGPLRNLNTVMDLLLSAGIEERLETWMNTPERFGHRPAQAAAALLAAGENERGAVMTTIKKAFEWARSDEMRTFLSGSSADFDDLLDDKIDVFIAVPLDQLGAQAVFMRLLINIVLGTVVRQDGRRVAQKRILLVMDEFVRLGRMEKLLDIANVAAGSGIEALFVTQDKGQIEAIYGKSDTDSLLGSCVTSRIFGLGRLESYTAEWAAGALGDQTVITRSVQAPTRFGEGQRISTGEQKQRLMTADQILGMPADEMLCLIGSKPPVRLKALVSHTHPAYRAKLDENPTRRA